jgi:hypothetical protein
MECNDQSPPDNAIQEQPRGRLLTDKDLATRWGLSVKTIRNWRCKGLGPGHLKLNGAVRFRLVDIISFENENFRSST